MLSPPRHRSRQRHVPRRAGDRLRLRRLPLDRSARPAHAAVDPDRAAAGSAATSPFAGAVRSILVDTSTDLRAQALANDVRRVDAILFTHSHADHVFGLDDVRRFNQMQKTAIPCFADAGHGRRACGGCSRTSSSRRSSRAAACRSCRCSASPGRSRSAASRSCRCRSCTACCRFSASASASFAYLTDCNRIPDESWPLLDGVRTLILDALRDRPHSTHFSVGEALDVVARLGAERTYFTHICHDLRHAATCAPLPAGVELAYDGLVLEIRDALQTECPQRVGARGDVPWTSSTFRTTRARRAGCSRCSRSATSTACTAATARFSIACAASPASAAPRRSS